MNLNQLEYFICAAENLNFTKAAKQCFISQTAMTQQIKALEKTVGVPLFVRDKHHVELSAAGAVYLKEAKAILRQSDAALRLARVAYSGTEGEITVGFISGYGQSDCAKILNRFHSDFPNIKMKFCRDTMSGLMGMVMRRDCDVAFTVQPHQQDYEEMNHIFIDRYPLVAVLPGGHVLAASPGLACADLAAEHFILMQPSARARDEMEEMLWIYRHGGFLPEITAVEKEPETISLMVALRMGVCILPEYAARPYLNREDIAIVPLIRNDGSRETLDFEMVWSKENANPAVEHLAESLRRKP